MIAFRDFFWRIVNRPEKNRLEFVRPPPRPEVRMIVPRVVSTLEPTGISV